MRGRRDRGVAWFGVGTTQDARSSAPFLKPIFFDVRPLDAFMVCAVALFDFRANAAFVGGLPAATDYSDENESDNRLATAYDAG